MAKNKTDKPDESKVGRKTGYRKNYPAIALGLAEAGKFSARTLAKKFGVSPQTILNWRKEHKDFEKAIEAGKVIYDEHLTELGLRNNEKLIKGYTTTEKTLEPALVTRNEKTGKLEVDADSDEKDVRDSLVLTKKVTKKVGPNPAAIRLQLERRDPNYKPNAKLKVDIPGLTSLLGMIDGGTKGKLPSESEKPGPG